MIVVCRILIIWKVAPGLTGKKDETYDQTDIEYTKLTNLNDTYSFLI